MIFIPRPYQEAAVAATWNYLRARPGNPCIVIPTGAGKTLVMAMMIRHALESWPGTRICVLAHTRELVSQNADKLQHHWREAPLGIYAAGLGRRDRFEPVIFASIQSVADKAMQLGRFDMLLIDECHRIPLKGDGQYRQFIADCARINPGLRVTGLTATAYRLGGGMVCGDNTILSEVVYEAGVGDLIRDGYLSMLISKGGCVSADLDDVSIRNGEYAPGELEDACNVDAIVQAACSEIVLLAADRQAMIVFCAGIAHAAAVAAALESRGVRCATVTGNTPSVERAQRIAAFQRGELRALVNVNVLAEGFDATHVDAVVMMRPTKSAGMYYQQVGRGMRLHPGKPDCLILDYAGNVLEHGPIDAITPPRAPGQKKKSAPAMRKCPDCALLLLVQIKTCPGCGYVFPQELKSRHDATAGDLPILSDGEAIKPIELKVDSVRYTRHEKQDKPPSFCVTYQCGLRQYREWICLEHGGIPRAKACSWWAARNPSGFTSIPSTVAQAFEWIAGGFELRKPVAITVRDTKPFPEIFGYTFIPMEKAA